MHSAPCLPRLQIRGPPEICHILRCTVATSSDHGCLALVSRGEAFPTAGTSRAYALHLQVPHHKKRHRGDPLSGSQTASFCVQTQPQRSSRRSFRCSGEILVLFITFVVASLSKPAVDSMPLMSLRLFSAFFHSASLSPCLISPPTFGTVQQSQVKSVGACQCQPIACSTLCTVATGPSHISSPFA